MREDVARWSTRRTATGGGALGSETASEPGAPMLSRTSPDDGTGGGVADGTGGGVADGTGDGVGGGAIRCAARGKEDSERPERATN